MGFEHQRIADALGFFLALSCAATRKCALKAALRFAFRDQWRHAGGIFRALYVEDFSTFWSDMDGRSDRILEVSERTGDILIDAIDLSTLPVADDLPE
ncbi:MAG: hypothetical protein B7X48_14545 [Acidiphilium sp. 34-60-192]|nr:MAG: hypothetical protein B7X48_14545 [Acidiphilium sp. 34-60-192]